MESIRIVERGADVGGTWYWNRYPGVACDVCAYDYLPLLDELDYVCLISSLISSHPFSHVLSHLSRFSHVSQVPSRYFAQGPEILGHCQKIADHFNLYDLAVFRTTVTTTTWDEQAVRAISVLHFLAPLVRFELKSAAAQRVWHIGTDRGDDMTAKFVIVANGTLSKPKLPKKLTDGLEHFKGQSFHTSRWDYGITGENLEKLAGKRVGFVGTGATGVQASHQQSAVACDGLISPICKCMPELDWPFLTDCL